MMEQISSVIYMDGNGLYDWSCLLVLILIISTNIYLQTRRLKKLYEEVKTKIR